MYEAYLKKVSTKKWNNIFTTVEIPADVPIIEITGDIFTEDTIPNNDVLQVGHDSFIGPSGTKHDYIKHSCNPNCLLHIVGNRAILYSLHVITAGSEITFDYSTSSTDTLEKWQMHCQCGSQQCRKIISGFQYLDKNIQDNYRKKGMVPMFITGPIQFI